MSSWGFEGVDNALNSWSSLSQFDDMVWDDFGESGDRLVPEPNSPTENGWAQNADRRKRLHRDPFHSAPKAFGQVSQRHGGAHKGGKEESMSVLEGSALQLHEVSEGSLGSGSWSAGGGGSVVTAADASAQPAPRTVAKEEPTAGPLCEDMGLYMDNPEFPSDEGSLLDSAYPFPLSDVGPTDDMDPFVAGSDADKGGNLLDYSWDSIDNLDDVDNLFRNSDSSFGQALSNTVEGMQWTTSPSRMQDCGATTIGGGSASSLEYAAVKGKLASCDTKMDFVPCNASLTLEKKELSCVEQALGDSSPSVSTQKLEQQPPPGQSEQATPPVSEDADTKMTESCGQTEQQGGATSTGNEITEEEAGPSTLGTIDADKAGLAQAHRARRHAANRKRSEDRLRRQFPPRKLAQSPMYVVPHVPEVAGQKGLQVRLPAQVPHVHGYASASPTVMIGDPHVQSSTRGVSYIHAGYGPPYHHVPMMVNGSSQIPQQIHPSQQVYVGYQQVSSHAPKPAHDQAHLAQLEQLEQQKQLRQHLDIPLRPPPTSSPTMTPQEKMEKLRWRQQMQARLAVQQQQQQLAQQVGLEQLQKQQLLQNNQQQQQMQGSLAQPPVDQQDMKTAGGLSEGEQESIILNQDASAGTSTGQEDGDDSLEAVVLQQLQSTMLRLDINTRVCIRDALFRLARSAMQRRASGDSGSSSTSSEGHKRLPGGVESSSGSNAAPSKRASRVGSINVVETETNPIDRSIANLLFHKRVAHPPPAPVPYYIPVTGDGTPYVLGPPQPSGAVANQWGWQPHLAPGNFAGSLQSPSSSGPSMTSTHDSGASGPGTSAAQSPGLSALLFDPRLSSPRSSVKVSSSVEQGRRGAPDASATASQGNFQSTRGHRCEPAEGVSVERPDSGGALPVEKWKVREKMDMSVDKPAQQSTRIVKAETDSQTSQTVSAVEAVSSQTGS